MARDDKLPCDLGTAALTSHLEEGSRVSTSDLRQLQIRTADGLLVKINRLEPDLYG